MVHTVAKQQTSRELNAFLERVDLPTLPKVAGRLISLLDDPDASMSAIAKVVAVDPALTAKVLRLVNSVYYGLERRITRLDEALAMIGLSTLKEICLSISIFDAMRQCKVDASCQLDPEGFWEHSLATAAAARVLTRRLGVVHEEDAFIGGLLHDLGKLLLAQYMPGAFNDALDRARREARPLYTLELEIIGMTHAQLGGSLADHWNLPHELVYAVRFSHGGATDTVNTNGETDHRLVSAVVLGNYLAKGLHLGVSGCPVRVRPETVLFRLGLKDRAQIRKIVMSIRAGVNAYKTTLMQAPRF